MTNKYPGLYGRPRKRKGGRVVTYYFRDRRAEGLPEECLGSNYDKALAAYLAATHHNAYVVGTLEEAFQAWERDVLPTTSPVTRHDYGKWLSHLRPVFGAATWDAVLLPDLAGYLERRTGKVQANREVTLLGLIWRWATLKGFTTLPWPAAGMAKAKWKNKEGARQHVPSDQVWSAIRAHGDQVLQDCMDLGEATGMRLTDCRTVLLPRGDMMRLEASKTGKVADFDLSLSAVLPGLVERRRAIRATHLMLLSTPDGRPVSAGMLRARWDAARDAAALAAADDELAAAIRATWLRDARKRAGHQLGLAARQELLQHTDSRVTAAHYPGPATVLKPAR